MAPKKSKKRSRKKKKTYTPAPEVPESILDLLSAIRAVESGEMTVTEAAKVLGYSRNHFQTLMHRGQAALIEAITPKAAGRPKRPDKEVSLEKENERLRRALERASSQVEDLDRQLDLTVELLHDRTMSRERSPKRKVKKEKKTTADDVDGDQQVKLKVAKRMLTRDMSLRRTARCVGTTKSSLKRWLVRDRAREHLARRRGPKPGRPLDVAATREAQTVIRACNGRISADAVAKKVCISRRQAADIKARTITAMERERRSACQRAVVTAPGVIRGFDAMEVSTTKGKHHLLIGADACVPFRTHVSTVQRYQGAAVCTALERDISKHGAPLVFRMDRAWAHRCRDVRALLDAHGVLLLHGPPHHPGYYGQTERQNRDHRAWLNALGVVDPNELEQQAERMLRALNELRPTRTLGWSTPSQLWNTRPMIKEDRQQMKEEVQKRAEKLQRNAKNKIKQDLAWRLSIEQALIKRGYLQLQLGSRC